MSKQDYDAAAATLGRVVQPIGGHLERALASPTADSKQINGQLDRIAVLVTHTKRAGPNGGGGPNLVLSLVTQCWPFFEQIVQRFGAEPKCAEKLCRLYKHALRNCKHEFEPLVGSLCSQLVAAFEHSFQSSYM